MTVIDEATAAVLHRVNVPETKMTAAALYAAMAVDPKRTSGSVGRDDGGSDGYAQALQASLTAAIRGCSVSMMAVCSAEQLLLSSRSSSLHALKSATAIAIAASELATDSALHRVRVAAAYKSEAVK